MGLDEGARVSTHLIKELEEPAHGVISEYRRIMMRLNEILRRRLSWRSLTVLWLLGAICAPILGLAQTAPAPRLPDTELGRHLAAFLSVFNTKNQAALADFVKEHYQPGVDSNQEAKRWLRHYNVYGPLTLHSVVQADEGKLTVFARGQMTKAWIELTARRSQSAPDRLRTIAVGEGLRPSQTKISKLTPPALIAEVRRYLNQLAREDFLSGAVLIAKGDKPLFTKAYGQANRSFAIPNRVDTKFNLGSITKIFTALAVLQLAERGKLSLDDAATKYLPDYPGPLDPRITIRHLLTHTSGMGRGAFDSPLFPPHVRTVRQWLPLTVAKQEFSPGEDVRYSNGAWIVLGAIIERVTGQSYDDYVRENIYRRAGMKNSDAYEVELPVPNLAVNYTHGKILDESNLDYDPARRRSAIFMNGGKGNPAGLTYATVEDLFRFRNALLANRLLSAEYTNRFLTREVELPAEPGTAIKEAYGYGWKFVTIGNTTVIEKDGGSWGVSARFDLYPTEGYTVAVLSNYESIALIVANYIRDLIVAD